MELVSSPPPSVFWSLHEPSMKSTLPGSLKSKQGKAEEKQSKFLPTFYDWFIAKALWVLFIATFIKRKCNLEVPLRASISYVFSLASAGRSTQPHVQNDN